MFIERVVVQNYRCLRKADVTLNAKLNVIVGNNECGKSTLLEATNLALTGQLNGRPLMIELHPFLFNMEEVSEYLGKLTRKEAAHPPEILIEVYLSDVADLARLKGDNNTLRLSQPGVSLRLALNPAYAEDFLRYVDDPAQIRSLPIEFYEIIWRDFADNDITNARAIPIKPSFIDASTIRNNVAASRYVIDIIKDSLKPSEKVDLALSYRMMRDKFMEQPKVQAVNAALAASSGGISQKQLSISLDTSARATWEAGVMPHLDEIPLTLVGKGEQSCVKIKLAMASSADCHIALIEEAENHLSYASLNELIRHIDDNAGDRQILITTHSSFVLNKLGVDSVVLFQRGTGIRLSDLSPDTQDYFQKLPGYDTLRLILAKRAILVEGPSDELIVQRAYKDKFGKLPIEDGVDVISVRSLAFKRFLEIAALLNRDTDVITDNDGSIDRLTKKYREFEDYPAIKIQYDPDETMKTLEPQLLKANGLAVVNAILGKTFPDEASAIDYMTANSNKTDVALKFFETSTPWKAPDYIARAIR